MISVLPSPVNVTTADIRPEMAHAMPTPIVLFAPLSRLSRKVSVERGAVFVKNENIKHATIVANADVPGVAIVLRAKNKPIAISENPPQCKMSIALGFFLLRNSEINCSLSKRLTIIADIIAMLADIPELKWFMQITRTTTGRFGFWIRQACQLQAGDYHFRLMRWHR